MFDHFGGKKDGDESNASLYILCICIYTNTCACQWKCGEINLVSGNRLGFGMLIFFTNLNFREFPVKVSHSLLHFSVRLLQTILEVKFSQKYPVNAGVTQGFILGPTLSLLYIKDLSVISKIVSYTDDTTFVAKT